MLIRLVNPSNCAEFDAYICSAPNGHFMQTSAWGRCRPQWEWQGLMEVDGQGEILGAMALLSRPISHTGRRQFYAPRGPVVPAQKLAVLSCLLSAAQQLVRQRGGCLLRMDPQIPEEDPRLRLIESYGFRITAIDDFSSFQPRFVYQIPLEGRSQEAVWQSLDAHTRYNIRLALRRGLRVVDAGPEGCGAFARLMAQTGHRKGFRGRSAEDYADILVNFGSGAHLWLALDGADAVAGILCIHQGAQMWNLYSGASDTGRYHKANELLQWHAMTWALERGCRVYDLRGVEGEPVPENPKYGLHQFKRHLGAQLVRYAGQMDWICRPVSYRMIRLAQRCLQALHRLPGQGMTAARSQLCRCLDARKSIFPMCAERKIQKN